MIKIYTIGFTEKSAQEFFELLENSGVKKIIDTRINNTSQLSGFAKGRDLAYFARKILGIDYEHELDFAPTKELLSSYRKKEISWEKYTQIYLGLLEDRGVKDRIDIQSLADSVLLCSEHLPEHCHRRLLAEYIQSRVPEVEIVHLV